MGSFTSFPMTDPMIAARIRRGVRRNETLEAIAEAVGYPSGVKNFRDQIKQKLGVTVARRRSAHAGTSKLSLPPRGA